MMIQKEDTSENFIAYSKKLEWSEVNLELDLFSLKIGKFIYPFNKTRFSSQKNGYEVKIIHTKIYLAHLLIFVILYYMI